MMKGEEDKRQWSLEVYNQGMMKTELCNKWHVSIRWPLPVRSRHHWTTSCNQAPTLQDRALQDGPCRRHLSLRPQVPLPPHSHRPREALLARPTSTLIDTITFSNYILLPTYITHHHHHNDGWSCTTLFWGCTYFSSFHILVVIKRKGQNKTTIEKMRKKEKE